MEPIEDLERNHDGAVRLDAPARAKSLDAENDVVEHLKTLPGVIGVWPSVRIPDPTRLQGAEKSTLWRSPERPDPHRNEKLGQ